jgi:AraC-like DNA-binding protein
MLVVETIGRIRREHLGKGKSIKKIARTLHLSRNTVRRILRSGETAFSYEREVQPRPKLGAWADELDRLCRRRPVQARLTFYVVEQFRRSGNRRRLRGLELRGFELMAIGRCRFFALSCNPKENATGVVCASQCAITGIRPTSSEPCAQ